MNYSPKGFIPWWEHTRGKVTVSSQPFTAFWWSPVEPIVAPPYGSKSNGPKTVMAICSGLHAESSTHARQLKHDWLLG